MRGNLKKYVVVLIILTVMASCIIILENLTFADIEVNEDKAIIQINFILPMDQIELEDYLVIESEYDNNNYNYTYYWDNSRELTIIINELSYPKGQRIQLKAKNLPSKHIIDKNINNYIQFKCKPEIKAIEPDKIVSTKGPINIIFNTLMDEDSMKDHVVIPFDHILSPLKYVDENEEKIDYSHWVIYPTEDLVSETEYVIVVEEELSSLSQLSFDKEKQITLKTDKKPLITSIYPDDGQKDVELYPRIMCESNEIIKKGIVRFEDISGRVKINDNQLEFIPNKILKQNKEYTMTVEVINERGEPSIIKEVTFTTMSIPDDQLWVEVALGDRQEVIVRQGTKIVKTMPCSGGKDESPTVLGTFYLKERGPNFYSHRFGEGADHWVRIIDQYLFHGIPKNKEGNTIQSELEKIGQPASHGCVRLLDEDAKWFYDNVPEGTMVIIYE